MTLQYNRSEYQNDWNEYSLTAGIGNSQTAQDLVLTECARHRAGRYAGLRVRQPGRIHAAA